ncbi:hypothetical protein L6452_20926 [Arctium lappa]|uniref:Uncharacterized protein n=1 Tax=Arctium lappa TaxID=4217 RepID=A0ACB9BCB5_ARCLA|nr:hypothetical protein L6452_20926 [Arctium lappa]
MENLKKKRSEVRGDARISGKKFRAEKEGCDAGVTADDAEIEEFFAILKRLQTGINYFQKKVGDNCDGKFAAAPLATASRLWNPVFELEDFNHVDDGRTMKINDGDALQNDAVVGFDLNADPGTD